MSSIICFGLDGQHKVRKLLDSFSPVLCSPMCVGVFVGDGPLFLCVTALQSSYSLYSFQIVLFCLDAGKYFAVIHS
jgi:hypothetical protein